MSVPRQQEHPVPSRLRPVLWFSVACAVAAVLGSLAHGTTRTWVEDAGRMGHQEGARRWAMWTFLCGATALAALVVGLARPRWRTGLAVVAAASFFVAARLAGPKWLRLRDERERERDYALHIASGLPVVTVAGAVGGVLALLLAIAWFRAERHAAPTSGVGSPAGSRG
jgi:hypothetical protein